MQSKRVHKIVRKKPNKKSINKADYTRRERQLIRDNKGTNFEEEIENDTTKRGNEYFKENCPK